jgi:hypothetical protein
LGCWTRSNYADVECQFFRQEVGRLLTEAAEGIYK